MRRENGAHDEDLNGVAERLRDERPTASPLELDRIKTSAMSRARAAVGTRHGARRLAVAGLTVGLLAASTGGVLAGQSGGVTSGNAAVAQYGNQCDVNNNNGAIGSLNGNGNGNGTGNGIDTGSNNGNGNNNGASDGNGSGNDDNNYNCNEDSFNTENITENITNNYAGAANVTNNYTTLSATPTSGVLGATSKKAATSKRRIKIHIAVPHGAKISKVTVKVNGKRLRTVKGKKASANVQLVNLPCGQGTTTVEVTVTLSSGKSITSRHKYHLCAA